MMQSLINRFLGHFGEGFADPTLTLGWRIRCFLIQKVFRINGHVPWPVHWTSQLKGVSKITRGTRFPGLAMGCYLDGRNGIILGNNVRFGPRVSIVSMNHDMDNFDSYITCAPVVIGDNCWLATDVSILPGVRLGNHVVCAAGAVVTKSFVDDNILIAGVPARVIKNLSSYRPTYENLDNTKAVGPCKN